MKLFLLALPLFLAGCLDYTKQASVPPTPECFEMQSSSDLMPIILNKCTGQTWLLSKTALFDEKGKAMDSFTYRWSPLETENGEPQLSSP